MLGQSVLCCTCCANMTGFLLRCDSTVAHCIALTQAWPMLLVQHFVTMLQPEHGCVQTAMM